MTPLCFLDTETDGVHPDRKVWEIAMVRRDDQGERETSFFVDIDLSTADPFGLSVGRFYERHPLGKYLAGDIDYPTMRAVVEHTRLFSQRQAAIEVVRWTHGAHVVGAVPNFDTEVLGNLLRDNELIPAWHYHLIDIEALMVGWLHATEAANVRRLREIDPGVKFKPSVTELPWKSDDLSRAIGVEPPTEVERHTALGDARWAMRVYDKITGHADEGVDQVDIVVDGRVIRSEAA